MTRASAAGTLVEAIAIRCLSGDSPKLPLLCKRRKSPMTSAQHYSTIQPSVNMIGGEALGKATGRACSCKGRWRAGGSPASTGERVLGCRRPGLKEPPTRRAGGSCRLSQGCLTDSLYKDLPAKVRSTVRSGPPNPARRERGRRGAHAGCAHRCSTVALPLTWQRW